MKTNQKKLSVSLGLITCLLTASSLAGQTASQTYSGNGNSGFGGAIGQGSLQIVNTPDGTLDFTLTRGLGDLNDSFVIYIDSLAGGFSNTGTFTDQEDDLRRAISNGNETLSFTGGFAANYAIGGNIGFGGLWFLASGGDGAHNYIDSVGLAPTGNPAASSITFSTNVSQLGLTPNSGQSFSFVVAYVNGSNAFSSDEAIGGTITGGNPGNADFTIDGFAIFTTIPEPSTYAFIFGVGVVGLIFLRRPLRRSPGFLTKSRSDAGVGGT
jgi:hypothetical protein